MPAPLPRLAAQTVRATALLALLSGAGLSLAGVPAARAEGVRIDQFQNRSVSSSGQFIIYCPDTRLRLAVVSHVETAKAAVLSALGVQDHWKIPIVVTMIAPETTRPGVPLTRLNLVHTDEGVKIDLVVALREDQFRQVHFPQMVIRAVLLELAYRGQLPAAGDPVVQPPAWLVEGIGEQLQIRQAGKSPNATLFRTMIAAGRIPPIREFLEGNVSRMDTTARTIFAECSASLLDMIIALPRGRRNLYQALRNLRASEGDPVNFLLQNFPSLGDSEIELERWWTLGIARYSASDRYISLTVAETDAKLEPLLKFQAVVDTKSGEKETFSLIDYQRFARLRSARGPLFERSSQLSKLHLQAHPLMRPVIGEYQRISLLLAEGRGRNLDKPLAAIANYRAMIVRRADKINDYMNWFEATQMPGLSGAFDGYLRAVDGVRTTPVRKRDDALTRYVDQVEREFQ